MFPCVYRFLKLIFDVFCSCVCCFVTYYNQPQPPNQKKKFIHLYLHTPQQHTEYDYCYYYVLLTPRVTIFINQGTHHAHKHKKPTQNNQTTHRRRRAANQECGIHCIYHPSKESFTLYIHLALFCFRECEIMLICWMMMWSCAER